MRTIFNIKSASVLSLFVSFDSLILPVASVLPSKPEPLAPHGTEVPNMLKKNKKA